MMTAGAAAYWATCAENVVSKSICKLKENYNTKIIYAYGRKLLINI